MKGLKAYSINFVGLSEGQHKFDYQLDKTFLSHFEASLIKDAAVEVALLLTKRANLLTLNLQMKGSVPAICDTCNEPFDLSVRSSEELVVKFVHELPADQTETDVIYLKKGEHQLYVADIFYESLMLSIPIRKVHTEDENGRPSCDENYLTYLENYKEVETEEEEEEEEAPKNAIWAELQKLKNDDDND